MPAIYLTLALTFFNFTGNNAMRVLLTLYALHLGAPATAVGVIGGLLFVFPVLLSWVVGGLADRKAARKLLMFAATCAVASLLLMYFFPTLPVFYAAAALNVFPCHAAEPDRQSQRTGQTRSQFRQLQHDRRDHQFFRPADGRPVD